MSVQTCGPNRQLIKMFDCYAAMCPDDVQKCSWIQEATDGEIWISLQQNIINTAVGNGKSISVPLFQNGPV